MKVILLKDNSKIGKKGDIKQVADGYATNYLIPNKIAAPATGTAIKQAGEMQKKVEKEIKNKEKEIKKFVSKLENKSITLVKEASDKGKLFAAVTVDEILDTVKKDLNLVVNKAEVSINEHIKEIGDHDVKLKIGPANISFKIKIKQK